MADHAKLTEVVLVKLNGENEMSSCGCTESAHQGLSLKESQRIGLPHPGLPAPLPHGEYVVWQGLPHWHSLARQLFHTRIIAAYFAVFSAWQAAAAYQDGHTVAEAAFAAVIVLASGALVIGVFELLAWLSARATIYTITNRRIVMRVGVALINTVDIPFKVIDALQVKSTSNGAGNISIGLKRGSAIPYSVLWPHARPWRLRRPEPMLRALPDVSKVASVLASQLEAAERAGAEALPDPKLDTQPESDQADVRLPAPENRPLLLGAAALVLLTLVSVGWIQLGGSVSERFADQSTQRIYELKFNDLGGDRLAVVDTRSERSIGVIEPGQDGLIRGALRGLSRTRDLRGLPSDAPYQLVIWDSGRVTLSDLGADRHVPLDAFGPSADGVLNTLVQMKDAGGVLTSTVPARESSRGAGE